MNLHRLNVLDWIVLGVLIGLGEFVITHVVAHLHWVR
jgi:hypothetical protein